MADPNDDILDDEMGEMGDMADTSFELDIDEDALLADDYDEKPVRRYSDQGKVEDEDFIEIGVEDDMSDDLKNDCSESTKKGHSTIAFDDRDSDEGGKERSRFKTERNIVSAPRSTTAIPETLDAVPVKPNNYHNNYQGVRGRGNNRFFRGGARGRHRGGGFNYMPNNGIPPGGPPGGHMYHQGPMPPHPMHPSHHPHSNIHVNPHFQRNNFNAGGGGMWNGWPQGGHPDMPPRPMAPQHFQDPNYGGNQPPHRWNEAPQNDFYQQPHFNQEDQFYNGSGPPGNDPYYQQGFAGNVPGSNMQGVQNNWEQQLPQQQQYYPPQNDQYMPNQPYPPQMDQMSNPQFRNMGPNNFNQPHHFGGGPPMHFPHPGGMPPQQRFPSAKMKFQRNHPRGGLIKQNNVSPTKLKNAIKQQRFEALRKVTLSNLHEIQMIDCLPKKTITNKVEQQEVEEDEEMKAYRKKIEEQKKMREAVLRQKEEKRKIAAQQKFQQLEAGGTSDVGEKPETNTTGEENTNSNDSGEYRIVRVRAPDGKTMLKKLNLAQIAKLKKVTPKPPASKNGSEAAGPVKEISSCIVAIDNLSASTTKKQLETMAKAVGPIQNVNLDAELKKAVIRFASPDIALTFKNKYQRRMVDLSMISVRLVAEEEVKPTPKVATQTDAKTN